MVSTGQFDLNMEEVLESWSPDDAVRELIANSFDESYLTNTKEPEIYKDKNGDWHICDYGRGLRYDHLTQSENKEKLKNPDKVIGKFGVGLKDALATLHRHNIDVIINSTHNTFTVEESPKHGFEEIDTLHVNIEKPIEEKTGTDIILKNINDEYIDSAKDNFLYFSDYKKLESTRYGDIYKIPRNEKSEIYITGLKVAKENNFLFTYDITNTTKKIRDSLNRERSNVGRTAYTSRIKKILKECESKSVCNPLISDLEQFTNGSIHDELSWKPIQVHTVKMLNSQKDAVMVTSNEKDMYGDMINTANNDGYDIVTIPSQIKNNIKDNTDIEGEKIRDMDEYINEYNDSFTYNWVSKSELSENEKIVWRMKTEILKIIDLPSEVKDIKISETIRSEGNMTVQGVWEPKNNRIVIKRSTLNNPEVFIGTLLHEIAHPRSGAPDMTRRFENGLTNMLGKLGNKYLEKNIK